MVSAHRFRSIIFGKLLLLLEAAAGGGKQDLYVKVQLPASSNMVRGACASTWPPWN